MTNCTKSLTLDISGERTNQYISAKQGDNNSRLIQITLMNGDDIVELNSSDIVKFRCLRPDNKSCKLPVTKKDDGTITVLLDDNVLAVAGFAQADIEISNSSGVILSTATFYIQVEVSATSNSVSSNNSSSSSGSSGGSTGADGVSVTHSWDGTVLTITSASGTSSADLKGDKGDTGATGPQGEKGADGKDYDYIESYVKTEAESVIERVIESQGNRTFTLACISDMHYGNDDYTDGVKHACQALKYIDERIKLDAVAVLGDYTDGMADEHQDIAVGDFKDVNAVLDKLRFAPNLRLQGNHDFSAEHSPITYRYIGAYNDDVEWGNFLGGYFYKDFSTYKLRIICLNTTEQNNTSVSPSTEQYQWFINSLDLSNKEDASKWQILILSHIPLDMWANDSKFKFVRILNAYKTGGTWSDGDEVSCDFSIEENKRATLIGNIHGHIHNFKYDKLYLEDVGTSEQSTIYRMATPNSCFGRENRDYTGYMEDTVYTKTENSATDTAFCVYCIDLDSYTINAICYGAGYDRKLNYVAGTVAETYSISNVLTNVTNSNTAKNVDVGDSYSATLTSSGTITSVIITMGGVDITETVYSNGTINIAEVTGNVVITAIAEVETPEEPEVLVNQLPNSTDVDGSVYNVIGYKANTRFSTSSSVDTSSNADGIYISGYIYLGGHPHLVRMENVDFKKDASEYTKVLLFSTKGVYNAQKFASDFIDDPNAVWDENNNLIEFIAGYNYIRIQCTGLNEDSVITIERIPE